MDFEDAPQATGSTAHQLSGGLRARLDQIGRSPWPEVHGEGSAWEVWSELFAQWGRRITLVDLYELEAARRGVLVADLPRADRDRMAALVLGVQYPGWSSLSWGNPHLREPIEVTPYDPDWPRAYASWEQRLREVLGGTAQRIDHVGSTAVAGLAAKPVIDIQVSVADLDVEAEYAPQLGLLGVPLSGRDVWHRYFRPAAGRPRTVQVHVCGAGSAWERDHLLFRDYLRAQPEVRHGYAVLKHQLAQRWRDDRVAYTDSKSSFILDTLDAANRWAAAARWDGPSLPDQPGERGGAP